MGTTFEKNLEKYAAVLVKVGLNLQPGQRLLIGAPLFGAGAVPLELAPLVRLIVTQAYRAGARLVDVMWQDEQLPLLQLQHAPRDSFEEYATWRAEAMLSLAKAGDAILSISAANPDLLAGQDPELRATVQRTVLKHVHPTMELLGQGAMNWSMFSAPVAGWTAKLFPELPPAEGQARFWDVIFEICRVKEADPVAAWQAHIRRLAARCNYLNQKRYHALKLTGPGTDLTVALPPGHRWLSGSLATRQGLSFTANIPTEEVFTLPHKDRIEGVVTATKPLSVQGGVIENFSLTFRQGQVTQVTAKKGEEILRKLIETDAGAGRLGEIALVPHSSPISQSGLLFYNILIDENAASHLALGRAYKFTMSGGETMAGEEFAAAGGNQSLIHTDFMVGSGEMDVDGLTEDGPAEPVMRAGEWAFAG